MDADRAKEVLGFSPSDCPSEDEIETSFKDKFGHYHNARNMSSDQQERDGLKRDIQELAEARNFLLNAARTGGSGSPGPSRWARDVGPAHPPPGFSGARQSPPSAGPPSSLPTSQPPPSARVWPRSPRSRWRRWLKRSLCVTLGLFLLFFVLTFFSGQSKARRPPPDGYLSVRPFPWARVTLKRGSRKIGSWDAPHQETKNLRPGHYTVLIQFPDDGEVRREVEILPGRTHIVVVNRADEKE